MFYTFQSHLSPLHMTCQEPDLEILVRDLLSFGSDLNYVDVEGHSALHFCALHGRTEAAKVLVSPIAFHFLLKGPKRLAVISS